MLGKLEFNLPEETAEFNQACRAGSLLGLLTEYDGWLRNLAKYENREQVDVQEARDKFHELITEYSLQELMP